MSLNHAPASSSLTDVTVGEAMHPGVIMCAPHASLPTVAATMIAHGIHGVVVMPADSATALWLTDLELVRASLEEGGDARAVGIAREPVATISSDSPLNDALAMMAVHYVAHLLVTDPGSDLPAGIVSSFDVAAVVGGWQPRIARMARPAPARQMASTLTLGQTTVSTVMYPGIATCTPQASLSTVARIMAEHRVHCIAMAGVDNTTTNGPYLTWGLIGHMDLMLALHGGTPSTPAARIAETAPISVPENESLDRAAALMVEHDTSHVVVVGRDGLPSGMVSTLEVARVLAASA